MYHLVRPLLFLLDPEKAHILSLKLIGLAGRFSFSRAFLQALFKSSEKPVEAFGLVFANPLGLAAGYDKDGLSWRGLACLGFGHIELGTVTPEPQPGNRRPRLFRIPSDRVLINRMGFPGRGAKFLVQQLEGRKSNSVVLGVSLGKSKATPPKEAVRDYLYLQRLLMPFADYLAINVSSPNTEGLRRLQARRSLEELLTHMIQERASWSRLHPGRSVPLLVKLSPDLSDAELDDALEAIQLTGVDGVIATNTTISRPGLHHPLTGQQGGLSGAPLFAQSLKIVRKIYRWSGGKLPIIGVGGIMSADHARQMLDAGAVLLQLYTGLVFEGPGLVKKILNKL